MIPDKNKHSSKMRKLLNQITKNTIKEFSPMWTNKQVWEFDQTHEGLTFDLAFVDKNTHEFNWNSKNPFLDSDIRDTVLKNFGLLEDQKMIVASKGEGKLKNDYFAYVMAVLTDLMIDEEIPLIYTKQNDCLSVTIDENADVIDCKEFFEEFYHLATGFNYEIDTGIPDDETEAEIYLTRLQEDFDEKMKEKLGEKYLPGNNDPESINNDT